MAAVVVVLRLDWWSAAGLVVAGQKAEEESRSVVLLPSAVLPAVLKKVEKLEGFLACQFHSRKQGGQGKTSNNNNHNVNFRQVDGRKWHSKQGIRFQYFPYPNHHQYYIEMDDCEKTVCWLGYGFPLPHPFKLKWVDAVFSLLKYYYYPGTTTKPLEVLHHQIERGRTKSKNIGDVST
uniref:Uncharacterized protein n=1 Tax=Ditylenchus dipsaci TaxID=166011 RepID=A0A915EB19_9BILA